MKAKVYNYRHSTSRNYSCQRYYHADGNDKNLSGIGAMLKPSGGEWPDDLTLPQLEIWPFIDIPLNEAAREFGFLLLDENKKGDDGENQKRRL